MYAMHNFKSRRIDFPDSVAAAVGLTSGCLSRDSTARFGNFFNSISPRFSMNGLFDNDIDTIEVTRLNAPGAILLLLLLLLLLSSSSSSKY
jgi:hypothetical protein